MIFTARWCSVVVAFCCAIPAIAANASYTGTFSSDDESQSFSISLSASATITVKTKSYAGGVNAAGATISQGGFDPTVSLFSSTGAILAVNRDGGCSLVSADSVTGACWDSYISVTLPAGSYRVVLTQSENLPNGPYVGNSFVFTGQGNFTSPGTSPPGFWDFARNQRTSAWAIDLLNIGSSTQESNTAAPVFSPVAGTYSSPQIISISSPTSGAQIYYTFGFAPPDETSAVVMPSQPISVCSTRAINAFAEAPGMAPSPVVTAPYVITSTSSPCFSASVTPASSILVPGHTASYTVSVAGVSGLSGPITFGVTGLPAGVTASFSPATLSGTGTTTMTLSTSSLAPIGTSSITVGASNGSFTANAALALTISPLTEAQHKSAGPAGGTLTMAFSSGNTAGNAITVWVASICSINGIGTPSDTQGNTYTLAASMGYSSMYYALNVKAGSNTISVNSGCWRDAMAIATEWAVSPNFTVTAASGAPNSGTNAISGGSFTTNNQVIAIIGIWDDWQADPFITLAAGDIYEIRRNTTPGSTNTIAMGYQRLSAITSTYTNTYYHPGPYIYSDNFVLFLSAARPGSKEFIRLGGRTIAIENTQ